MKTVPKTQVIVCSILLWLTVFEVKCQLKKLHGNKLCPKDEISRWPETNTTECHKCPICKRGHGSTVQCGDVLKSPQELKIIIGCKRCEKGKTFSPTTSNQICLQCKQCEDNRKVIQKCTRRRNTRCGNCMDDSYAETTSFGMKTCEKCSICCGDGKDHIVQECIDKGLPSNRRCKQEDRGRCPHASQAQTTITSINLSTPKNRLTRAVTSLPSKQPGNGAKPTSLIFKGMTEQSLAIINIENRNTINTNSGQNRVLVPVLSILIPSLVSIALFVIVKKFIKKRKKRSTSQELTPMHRDGSQTGDPRVSRKDNQDIPNNQDDTVQSNENETRINDNITGNGQLEGLIHSSQQPVHGHGENISTNLQDDTVETDACPQARDNGTNQLSLCSSQTTEDNGLTRKDVCYQDKETTKCDVLSESMDGENNKYDETPYYHSSTSNASTCSEDTDNKPSFKSEDDGNKNVHNHQSEQEQMKRELSSNTVGSWIAKQGFLYDKIRHKVNALKRNDFISVLLDLGIEKDTVHYYYPYNDVGRFGDALEALTTSDVNLTLEKVAQVLEKRQPSLVGVANLVREEDQRLTNELPKVIHQPRKRTESFSDTVAAEEHNVDQCSKTALAK